MNAKAKGNGFERNISEALSLWLTEGEEKRACWRSDTSGAAATVWAKKGQEARYVAANAGDIRQIAEKGIYPSLDKFFDNHVIECKAYAKIDLYPPFNKTLVNWFEQIKKEKETTGKKGILIMKANNRKTLFCYEGQLGQMDPLLTINLCGLSMNVYLFDEVVKHKYESKSS